MKYNIILCEGETDQILLGYYLSEVSSWAFFKFKESPFPEEEVNWFKREDEILGIWQVGGNDFLKPLSYIFKRSMLEDTSAKIAIVTDNDDNNAGNERLQEITDSISRSLNADDIDISSIRNEWLHIEFENDYAISEFDFCYILVPWNEHGALETFMLNSLSEQSAEHEDIIKQCRGFIGNFKSDFYLKKKREKVKAELGVALSVMSPDKIFTTMNELISSVNWAKFGTTHIQFEKLREL